MRYGASEPRQVNLSIVNQSTITSELTLDVNAKIAAAIQRQLSEHVASLWQAGAMSCEVAETLDNVPTNNCPIVLLNDSDQAGALGYHATTPDGRPYARVFVAPIMVNGGTLFEGNNCISATISHEAAESSADPYALWWCDMPDGTQDALELCDRVESDVYAIDGISVSNFLAPRAFSQGPGPYDFMNLLTSPFEIRPGGYAIRRNNGVVTTPFGAEYPSWKKSAKAHAASRTSKRGTIWTPSEQERVTVPEI